MGSAMLNRICSNTHLPKKNLSDLKKGEIYIVIEKQVNTKFVFEAVVVIDAEFQVFLPNRVSKALEENGNLFDEHSERGNKYKLFFVYQGEQNFEFRKNV